MTQSVSSSAYTPGPWFLDPVDLIIYDGELVTSRAIATVEGRGDNGGEDEWEANARLIAAAPGMFEALGKVLELCHVHDPNTGFYQEIDPYELHAAVFTAYMAAMNANSACSNVEG